VANVVTCAVLMLFGMLAFAAGCSSMDGSATEPLESTSQAQIFGQCDVDCDKLSEGNPCATFTCDTTTGTCKIARVLLKEGALCAKGLTCHLGLCCSGCVVAAKRATPMCALRGGVEDVRCGASGETCGDCTADACQVGTCVSRACELKPVGDGQPCTKGGGACYKGSCCRGCLDKSGACQPGGALDACGISDGKLVECKDCTDTDACTAEACASGSCQYPASVPGTSCADGDLCNGNEACSGTSCEKGKALDCDDGNPCTKDSCDGGKGCLHEVLTGDACSDGDACTTNDKCGSDGLCKPGAQINCDDGEVCTSDSCKDGNCLNTPKANTATCDDGNICTTGDKCTDGVCKGMNGTTPEGCNDNNPCTIDAQPDCSLPICTHTPTTDTTIACPAGDACHANGYCSGIDDKCVAGAEKDCADTSDCTKDTCDPVTGCVYTNDASADCSDGDPCTENDVCVGGLCGGKPKKCLALDACHEGGTCDETTGKCDDPRADEGTACPGGACENGTCILDPNVGIGGEGAGGADATADGGEPATSAGGAGTGGSAVVGEAGAPTAPQDGEAGSPGAEEPERPFVRKPGGCSCSVPQAGHDSRTGLLGLAFLAVALRRRARRGRLAA
jgi:MYXO-CTERM domain-containing protein